MSDKVYEIKDVKKGLLEFIKETAKANGCKLERQEWKSKYNSYVVYDYEPFCSDGFEINLEFTCDSNNHFEFLKYLYEKRLSEVESLNNLLQV